MQQRIWGAALLASVGWGTGTVVSRMALENGAGPYEITLVRGALAAAAVILLLAVRGRLRRPGPVTIKVGAVMAISNMAIPFVLGTVSLQYAGAGFVALPTALIPLTTAAMAHVLLPAERLDLAKVLGLAVALTGVAVLLLSGDSGLADGGRPLIAGIMGLISVVAISAGGIYSKRHAGNYGLLDVSAIQFGLGAAIIAVAAMLIEGRVGVGPVVVWPWLIYLAAASTFIPVLLYYWMIRHVTATYAAAVGYIVPLVAVILGVVALGEELQPGIVLGGGLILAGVILTDRLEHRRAAPPSR